MLIIPAIDILDKKVVRLYQGRKDRIFFYSASPLEKIKEFSSLGIKLVHIVDLNGALENAPQFSLLEEISKNIDIEFFWAGGLRTRERILKAIDLGAKKVVVSSLIKDIEKFEKIIQGLQDKIIVSLDVKEDKIYIKGWKESLNADFKDIVQKLKDLGIKEFIITDIEKDGTLSGLNIEKFKNLLKDLKAHFYIAGGITKKEDILTLKDELKNLKGVIIGRALYEGRLNLKDLIKTC